MNRVFFVAAWLVVCVIVQAQPRYLPYEVRLGTNAATVAVARTDTQNPIGYLDEILIQGPSKLNVTAAVSVASVPSVGTGMVNTVFYTNGAMTAASVVRPRVPQTDNAGATNAYGVSERFLCAGDPVTLRVVQTSVVTQVVFKVWLKLDQ